MACRTGISLGWNGLDMYWLAPEFLTTQTCAFYCGAERKHDVDLFVRARSFMRFTARELLLAIAIFAVLVGSFVHCQVVSKALSVTHALSGSLPGPAKYTAAI